MNKLDDDLRLIAAAKNWKFLVGYREDVNRLNDVVMDMQNDDESNKIALFLEPPKYRPLTGDYGVTGHVWTGHLLLVQLSQFDAGTNTDGGTDYTEAKFLEYIKPLYDESNALLGQLVCKEYDVSFEVLPFINAFDWNGDGLSVKFTATLKS